MYGMTQMGGNNNYYGTIFKITKAGDNFEVIHNFAGGNNDGKYPYGGLILDGNYLYGMTSQGGTGSCLDDEGDEVSCGTSRLLRMLRLMTQLSSTPFWVTMKVMGRIP